MKYLKLFESYNSEQEYINDIIDQFKSYNIRPVVLNQIISFYSDTISKYYDDGTSPKTFVDEIVKDMELDSGGYYGIKMTSTYPKSNFNL